MIRLLKNDFFKIYKEKAHLILAIILAASTVLMIGLLGLIESSAGGVLSFKETLYLSTMGGGNLGVIAVLSVSIYIGNDFRNRTVNLKIFAGHSRTKIFAGMLLINLIAFSTYFIFNALFFSGLTLLFFGGFGAQAGDILIKTLLMLPPYLAIISIATFISLSLKSVLGIVINLVILMAMNMAGQVINLMSMMPSVGGDVLGFISEVVPYFILSNISSGGLFGGLLGQDTGFALDEILKNIIGSGVFIAGAITGSFFIFRRKPLI